MKYFTILLYIISFFSFSAFGEEVLESPTIKAPTFINQRKIITITPKSDFVKLGGRMVNPLKSLDSKGKYVSMVTAEQPINDSLRLVQLNGEMDSATLKEFEQQGYKIYGYIPDNTYIVKIDSVNLGNVKAMNKVRWTGNYAPEYRLSDKLNYVLKIKSQIENITVKAVFTPDSDLNSCISQTKALGTVDSWSADSVEIILEITLPVSKINALSSLSQLVFIEYAPRPRFMNNKSADIMSVREMRDVWGFYGSNEIVAVADSGIDIGTLGSGIHDDFEDGAGNSRIISIYDVAGDGADDRADGHGTHVAGSVLGNGKMSGANPLVNSFPDTCYAGSAPKAKLVFQALGKDDGSLTIPSDLRDLFGEAYADDAKIHQNSWGISLYGAYNSYSRALDDFAYNNPDMLICFSAGNSGADTPPANGVVDLGSIGAPATAKNCITVGSSEGNRPTHTLTWANISATKFSKAPIKTDRVADDTNGMAASSSRGPCDDGRIKPDIVAPGTYIASTRTHAISIGSGILWRNTYVLAGNSNYVWSGGTSMAAPLVSGAAAVLRNYLREECGVANPPAVLLKSLLLNGATDLNPGQYGTGATREMNAAPNNVEGWGIVNLENSLFKDNFYSMEFWNGWDNPVNNPGIVYTNFVFVNTNYPAKFLLTWTDFMGSLLTFNTDFTAVSGGGLVNDLDLYVIDPNGNTNLPLARNTNVDLYYYTNNNSLSVYNIGGLFEAERCTAPELPLTLSNIELLAFDIGASGGDIAIFIWAGSDTIGQPGAVLFSQTNTVSAGGGLTILNIPVNVTITTTNFYIGSQQISGSNMRTPRDGSSDSPRSWQNSGGGWAVDTAGDLWIHVYGSAPNNDHVNSVEGIIINNPMAGTYRVEVSASNIPYPPVRYSVAVSGGLIPEPGLFWILNFGFWICVSTRRVSGYITKRLLR